MRLKSVEMASRGGHWERAQFLELAEKDDTTFTSQAEEAMVAQEVSTQRKLSGVGKGSGSSSGWGNYGGASWGSGKGGKDK
eukprot:155970-Pyramimonas_sp.AAC.1